MKGRRNTSRRSGNSSTAPATSRTPGRIEEPQQREAVPRLWRDPWALATLLPLLALVAHSLGAPLGEPVADDFDHLHYALFSSHQGWLDGGGSQTFWRPLAYQAYYGLLTPALLAWPPLVVVLQALLLALAGLLLYRVLRRFMPGPWAASAASFAFLAESTRALICVPVHFVDVGLIAFSALAFHEAAFGRLPSALLALAASLLCKESAIATALLLPWVSPNRRLRWAGATAAVSLAWGTTYLVVRTQHGMTLPRGLESNLGNLGGHAWDRLVWAATGSLRAMFSLPAAASPLDAPLAVVLLLLAAATVGRFAFSATARARFTGIARTVVIGTLWSAVATAPLVTVWPIWSPQRVAFGSLGLGVALSATLGAAHPALLGSLVALRGSLFALSPSAPATIDATPPETGAFVDFVRLTRVQRLMRGTREALRADHPSLPRGARVGLFHPPLMTEYAFGGDKALQVWFRDTTLRWLTYEDFKLDPTRELDAIVVYEPERTPQMMLLEPAAMHHYLLALRETAPTPMAFAHLAAADSLQRDTTGRIFRAHVAGARALNLIGAGSNAEAKEEAYRGLGLWAAARDARFALALIDALDNRLGPARAHLDTLFGYYPHDTTALILRDSIDVWTGRR